MSSPHLLVDFAGVIGRHQRDDDLQTMADLLELPLATFLHSYWDHRVRYDRGLRDSTYWELVAGRPVDIDAVRRLVVIDVASWVHLDNQAIEALASHDKAGAHMTLLSNAPQALADAVRNIAELAFFDHFVFSCELGIAKPDTRAFDRALVVAGQSANNTVFIDDRSENIDSAERLGIRGVLFHDAADIVAISPATSPSS